MNFMTFSNKHVNDIPNCVVEFGSKLKYSGTFYCSTIGMFRNKLYEVVYGVNKTTRGIRYQRLLMIPEEGQLLLRNCYFGWGMSSGFHSYGYDKKDKKFSYGEVLYYSDEFDEAVSDFPISKVYRELLTTQEEITKLDSSLRYACYTYNCSVEPIEYFRIYKAFPKQAEMLMKFRLYRMISKNNCDRLSREPRFHKWLERHHQNLWGVAFQTAFNSWKKNPECSVRDYETSLSYRIMCGKEVSQRNKPVYEKALKHTTQERLYEWQKENHIKSASYMDYLVACDWLKLDFSDTKVLFPRNFQEVHDNYTAQYGEWKREQDRIEEERIRAEREKRNAEEMRTLGERLRATSDKFSFLSYGNGGYLVLVAKSKQDLIDEGSALGHCVGRMDYDKRMANGKEVICFIRKKEEPSKPFVTAQVIVGDSLRVNQCYGYKDSIVPEVNEFKEQWMQYANKRYKDAV